MCHSFTSKDPKGRQKVKYMYLVPLKCSHLWSVHNQHNECWKRAMKREQWRNVGQGDTWVNTFSWALYMCTQSRHIISLWRPIEESHTLQTAWGSVYLLQKYGKLYWLLLRCEPVQPQRVFNLLSADFTWTLDSVAPLLRPKGRGPLDAPRNSIGAERLDILNLILTPLHQPSV